MPVFGLFRRRREEPKPGSAALPTVPPAQSVPTLPPENKPEPADWLPRIQAALERFTAGRIGEPLTAGPDGPDELMEGLEKVRQAWNNRMVRLARAVSEAVEKGVQPLVAADRLAATTEEQSQQITQIAAFSEELSASVSEVAASSEQIHRVAQETLRKGQEGTVQVGEALRTLTDVAESVEALQAQVRDLSAVVAPIRQVLDLIEEISDQTNLLALNAAIEAARAGDAGRGFAVVADEVRRLAVRTQRAVADVRTQVGSIHDGVTRVETAIDQVGGWTRVGVERARNGQEVLDGITHAIEETIAPLERIAGATEQQAEAVARMAGNAQSAAEASAQVRESAAELAAMTLDLGRRLQQAREVVGEVETETTDVDLLALARADHLLWVQRLHGLLLGREKIDPNSLSDHTKCRLGRWYERRGREHFAHNPAFVALAEPHRRLHQLAEEVVRKYDRRDLEGARRGLEEVERLSHAILDLLDDLSRAVA